MTEEANYQAILKRAKAAGRAAAKKELSKKEVEVVVVKKEPEEKEKKKALAKKSVEVDVSKKVVVKKERQEPKNTNKVNSGNRLSKHPGASAWRTALSDCGYLNKDSEFKKFPKKGTSEYNRVKELQRAYENKL